METIDQDREWQSHLESLRSSNSAYTPESGKKSNDIVRDDFRAFDIAEMNREISQHRLGRNILEETMFELEQDELFSKLIEITPHLSNTSKMREMLMQIPISRVRTEKNWAKERNTMQKRGITNDRVRQAGMYGLKTVVSRLLSDRPSEMGKTLNALNNTVIMERDTRGSRGGVTTEGPLIIFNLGVEHGKYSWMAEFIESEVSEDSEFTLAVSTLGHEGGHILDGSRQFTKEFATPSRRYTNDLDVSMTDIPIRWSNDFGSDTLNLSRREMFAEGVANQVIEELGLDNNIIRDYRMLYYAWTVAHLNLISPTDLSFIYEQAQNLFHRGSIPEPVCEKVGSIYDITSGHPIAVNYPLNQSQISNLLHI